MWGGGETLSSGGRVGTGYAATVCQGKGQPSGAGPGLVTGSQGVQGEGSGRPVDERPAFQKMAQKSEWGVSKRVRGGHKKEGLRSPSISEQPGGAEAEARGRCECGVRESRERAAACVSAAKGSSEGAAGRPQRLAAGPLGGRRADVRSRGMQGGLAVFLETERGVQSWLEVGVQERALGWELSGHVGVGQSPGGRGQWRGLCRARFSFKGLIFCHLPFWYFSST